MLIIKGIIRNLVCILLMLNSCINYRYKGMLKYLYDKIFSV